MELIIGFVCGVLFSSVMVILFANGIVSVIVDRVLDDVSLGDDDDE